MLFKNRNLYILADMGAVLLSFFLTAIAQYASVADERLIFGLFTVGRALLLDYILVILFYQPKKRLVERGYWEELRIVIWINMVMMLLVCIVLCLGSYRPALSGSFYMVFFLFNCLLMYMGRLYIKSGLWAYYERPENRKRVLLCANHSNVDRVLDDWERSGMYDRELAGVAVLGTDCQEKNTIDVRMYEYDREQQKLKLMDRSLTLMEYTKKYAVDEALLSIPDYDKRGLENLIQYFETMGIHVYVTANTFGLREREKLVENFGVYHVLTYAPRVFNPTELMLKRIMDILGSIVGLVLTGLLSIVVVPLIYLESPGPVIFTQIRIGLNGRRFKMYKFRSMYMDAEKKKQELMAQNEMKGLMFKMKDDPRITRIGKFIRSTSIDEFPQFLNVLKGEMSLVGTRPPTEDEFMQYEERHKRRLSLKPGITGLWQVSGRSDIQDFEEVVQLDCEYIDRWSLGLDIKILMQTVLVVLKKHGAE